MIYSAIRARSGSCERALDGLIPCGGTLEVKLVATEIFYPEPLLVCQDCRDSWEECGFVYWEYPLSVD